MINIRVYDAFATEEEIDKNNGLCVLRNVLRCEATARKNGEFYIELEYALFVENDYKREHLIVGNIIECEVESRMELFRITDVDRTNHSKISLVAEHILFDLDNFFLDELHIVNKNCDDALNYMFYYSINDKDEENPFYFISDITDITNTAYYVRKSLMESLIELDNCLVELWGAELIYNRFTLKALKSAGIDTDYELRFNKNITSIETNESTSKEEVITKIMPTGLTNDNVTLILPEKFVVSKNVGRYRWGKVKEIHYSDLKEVVDSENPEENISKEEIYELLRERALYEFEVNKVDLHYSNITVKFITTENINKYEDISRSISLYDTVTVIDEDLDIRFKAKVVKTKYDCLKKQFIECELGSFKKDIFSY